MSGQAIRFRRVDYRIQGQALLEGIDLDIGADERVALLGPNGSGKSSLIRLVRGEARAHSGSGECSLFGKHRWNLFEMRSLMGVVSMELERALSPNTVAWDLVASGLFQSYDLYRNHHLGEEGRRVTGEAIASLGLEGLSHRRIGGLSSGEMRRFLIARALVNDPRILVLDEPMTGMDIIARKSFRETMSALAAEGKGLLMATHDMEDIVPEVDRVVMLKEGRVFRDGAKEELLNDETMSSLFGVPVKVLRSGGSYHASV